MHYSSNMHVSEMRLGRRGGEIPPPPGPHKEVHITDLATFQLCRRKWDYSSMLRRGLQPAVLPEPLLLGQGVHLGLDHGYRAGLDNGGVMQFDKSAARRAFRKWLDRRREAVIAYTGPLWEAEEELFDRNLQLGLGMLSHYSLWAKAKDPTYEVLGLEKQFELKLPGSYPSLYYAGRFDGLVRDKTTDKLYILEFKTSRTLTDKSMSGVFRSMQATAYTWAATQIYGKPVSGVLYRVLWKKAPANPHMTGKGHFSYAKTQAANTSVAWVEYYLRRLACQVRTSDGEDVHSLPTAVIQERHQELRYQATRLIEMLREHGREFFMQRTIHRTPRQIDLMLKVLKHQGQQMANPRVMIYPMSGYHCSFCHFTEPCDLYVRGLDFEAEALLAAAYGPRSYWEGDDDAEA